MAGEHMVEWAGDSGVTVRFALPAAWTAAEESNEGQRVGVFTPDAGPACPGAVLRVLTDARIPPAGGAHAMLHEMAIRFVRPQDPRASDRSVEERPGGGLVAQAMMLTDEEGVAAVHYLWMLGSATNERVCIAMFNFSVPASLDGQENMATLAGMLDGAIRVANLAGPAAQQ
jgi:hypothetical protein